MDAETARPEIVRPEAAGVVVVGAVRAGASPVVRADLGVRA
ncbi:hypothetical protein [Amaricoccus sp.]|nr:hypothetical protein [Amaricoccus sp.]